jgi:hypothetical protein
MKGIDENYLAYSGIFNHIERVFDMPIDAVYQQEEKLNPIHYVVTANKYNDYRQEVTIQEFYDARNSARIYAGYCKALNMLYYSFNTGKG